MKRFTWLFLVSVLLCGGILLTCSKQALGSAEKEIPVTVSVDPRVELMSIIFRLAGNPEYAQGRVESYTRDVEEHFGPYKNHPVVKLAAQLRETRGVSFDAPMSMAVHLSDGFELKERIPFDPQPENLDGRWRLEEAREFLEKARQFVKETKFEEFFTAHQPLYDQATGRMEEMLRQEAQLGWFEEFFGARPGATFNVVLGMLNGGSCYGPRIKVGNMEELYCMLGVWKCDSAGTPSFDASMLSTIVHEFCHSYANPVVDAHLDDLEAVGQKLYAAVSGAMRRQAYGSWETMMRESLVRACVVRYLAAVEGKGAAKRQINQEVGRQFLWMEGLSDTLAEYEAKRGEFPTLAVFFPRIAEFFERYMEEAAAAEPVFYLPKGYNPKFEWKLSPDGRRLAFTGWHEPDPEDPQKTEGGLWVYDLQSKEIKQLLSGWFKTPIVWSPDSRLLAASMGQNYTLYLPLILLDVERGELIDLDVQGAGPAFSPDGTRLAFTGGWEDIGRWYNGVPDSGSMFVISVVIPRAKAIRISPEGQRGCLLPCWSPDGTRVAYQVMPVKSESEEDASRMTEARVFIAQADGSGVKEIYKYSAEQSGGTLYSISWTPAGDALRISTSDGEVLAAADGSGVISGIIGK
jgi:hypothetical protein